ncbi:DUF4272 domain-containing protein [Pandoraea sp. NPDC090278]|uniref:DUF4272 domain-containing protein n=1 Tax=Pandoraea sp. NPDC090278 TaxID=3364391 RepID=UPI00383B79CC
MDFEKIRSDSTSSLALLGFPKPATLPFLDGEAKIRSLDEIESRSLALSVVVAVAYGFPRERAMSWLDQERLAQSLSDGERTFLEKKDASNSRRFQVQAEALCTFAWTLGYLPALDFSLQCPENLVQIYPDFRGAESSKRFRGGASLISADAIFSTLDLAYCLHWGVNEALLSGSVVPSNVQYHVVTERRRALEWITSGDDWDGVSLDT